MTAAALSAIAARIGFYYDWTYIFVIIGAIFSAIAAANVRGTYAKWSRVPNQRGITGADAAAAILRASNTGGVRIQSIPGRLTDHYNPREQSLGLSEGVYGESSIAAVGIAAHEAGHAIQHGTGYSPLHVRNAIVPVVNIGSRLSFPILLVGFMIQSRFGDGLLMIGVVLFSLSFVFTLIALPVEFNASRRALEAIEAGGLLTAEELRGTRSVLRAAALTYVAAAAASLLSLLRIILLVSSRGRSRRR
ncbi:MAG: zinc metallopeptidase [Bacillota bacterium]|nr:zinc metallopeptidase [Bacillota bacterium]